MSVLLTVPLGPHPPSSSLSNAPQPIPYDLRVRASEVLGKIAAVYGPKYSGLLPRQSYSAFLPCFVSNEHI